MSLPGTNIDTQAGSNEAAHTKDRQGAKSNLGVAQEIAAASTPDPGADTFAATARKAAARGARPWFDDHQDAQAGRNAASGGASATRNAT